MLLQCFFTGMESDVLVSFSMFVEALEHCAAQLSHNIHCVSLQFMHGCLASPKLADGQAL